MVLSIQEKIIRYFIHPIRKEKPQIHLNTLKNIRNVIIIYPEQISDESQKNLDNFLQIQKQIKQICIIKSNAAQKQISLQIGKSNSVSLPKNSLIKLLLSTVVRDLKNVQFDLLIDLDLNSHLLGVLLCRILNPAIKLSYRKPLSSIYYNLEYSPRSSDSNEKQLKSMIAFLEKTLHNRKTL